MSIQLTREELYDLVWSRPVTKVAAELEISDVALHKICRRHDVPVPPRGHWAKLAAGKPIQQTPLSKSSKARSGLIEIIGSPAKQLPRAVLEAQKLGISCEATLDERSAIEEGAQTPQIRALRNKLSHARPMKDGFIRISGKRQFSVSVTPATKERAARVLERIVGAALTRGYALLPSNLGLALNIDGQRISLAIQETTDRVPHVATSAESAKLDRWERNHRQKTRQHEWISAWDKPKIPEYDEVSSGRLCVEIDKSHSWDGLRRRFCDGKRQRVEDLAGKIVTAATACAASAIEREKEAERRQREREEYEAHRQERERQRILEDKRWEFLECKARLLEKAQYLDQFVNDYSHFFQDDEIPQVCQDLLTWASKRALRIRDSINPSSLASILEKHDLMNDQADIATWTQVDS